MASDASFDVVSEVDEQELANALDQTRREIAGRFDFKNSNATIEYAEKKLTVVAADELKLKNVIDVFQTKANKRGIALKAFEYGKPEAASGGAFRQVVTVKNGIAKDKSKALIDAIKSSKLKVQTQFQDEQIRVTSKSRDELQKAQQLLRELDYEIPLQFTNYR